MEQLINLILKQVKQKEISKELAHQILQGIRKFKTADTAILRSDKERPEKIDLAVIGMAARFPGANSVNEYWSNLLRGKDCITEYPKERWVSSDYQSSESDKKGSISTQKGGFVDSIDKFASFYFNVPVEEAKLIDPQQRLFLEISSETFQHAGYNKKNLWNSQIGVFVGARMSTYKTFGEQKKQNFRSHITGNIANFIATRVSDFYNLKGPSVVLDTACSSSLVAVHFACQSLYYKECKMALVGGINLHITPYSFLRLKHAGILSNNDKSYVFDQRADGFVIGEGTGAVLIKPLSAAVVDGDTVYAVIKGSAINNDGNTMGMTTPNFQGQKDVIRQAYKNAGVNPASVTLIEAHGTGTAIGDPIEIKALTDLFSEFTNKKSFCAIGSVKTNIGHLDTAAGIAGLLKIILALHHKQLPSTLHCKMPNPRLNLVSSPFYPIAVKENWEPEGGIRRSGISSFGFGGTNCHIVLQEAPEMENHHKPFSKSDHLFTLSAENPKSIIKLIDRYRTFFENHPSISIENVCYTVNKGRDRFPYRLAVVTKNIKELKKQLDKISIKDNHQIKVPRSTSMFYQKKTGKEKLVFLFPGQGSQYPGMAKHLFEGEPVFRNSLKKCDKIVKNLLKISIIDSIYRQDNKNKSLNETLITQPILFSIEYSLAQLWLSWNLTASVVMGHSLGEYVAACLAEVFTLEDALMLVVKRSQLMHEYADSGSMVMLFCNRKQVSDIIDNLDPQSRKKVSLAAINGPKHIVVSGPTEVISKVIQMVQKVGIHISKLAVSHAFHSPLMISVADRFKEILQHISFNSVKIPIICNTTGQMVKKGTLGKQYWMEHILKPVLFEAGINNLVKSGFKHFLEVGPGTTLSSLVKTILKNNKEINVISSLHKHNKDYSEIGKTLGKLFVCGFDVDLDAYEDIHQRQRIALPLYFFDRERCWIDQKASRENVRQHFYSKVVNFQNFPLLADHSIRGVSILPGACFWELIRREGALRLGKPISRLCEISHRAPLEILPKSRISINVHFAEKKDNSFKVNSVVDNNHENPVIHVIGKVETAKTRNERPLDISKIMKRLSPSVYSSQQIYGIFKKSGVSYGKTLQTIKNLWVDKNVVLAELGLPVESRNIKEYDQFHPALLDGALQSILGIVDKRNSSVEYTYVPFFIEEIIFLHALPSKCYSLLELKKGEWGNEILQCFISVMDSKGNILLKMNGLHFKQFHGQGDIDSNQDHSSLVQSQQRWFYIPLWNKNPLKDIKYSSLQYRLIFCLHSPVHSYICTKLKESSQGIVKVFPGKNREEISERNFSIRINEAEDYIWLLKEIARKKIVINQALHFWAYTEKQVGPLDIQGLMESQSYGVLSLFNFVKALVEIQQQTVEIRLISSYSQKVGRGEDYLAIEKSPLLGLSKVIPLEYPNIKCSYIDLPFPRDKSFAELEPLFKELKTKISEPLVALKKDNRWVPGLERIFPSVEKGKNKRLKNKGVYIITGGLGGIGFTLAKFLAKEYRAKLVLLSRSNFPAPEEWEPLLKNPNEKKELIEKIQDIKNMEISGAQILICQADVADKEQMLEVKGRINALAWSVNGIFHAAGIIKDKLIHNKNQKEFIEVLKAKVTGTWMIYELFSHQNLDFFILFSSIVSVFGNRGQSDYVAANNFMDSFASWYGPAISLNWTMWSETGMAAQSGVINKSPVAGLKPFLSCDGIEAMFEALQTGENQVMVMNNPLEDLQGHDLSKEKGKEGEQKGYNRQDRLEQQNYTDFTFDSEREDKNLTQQYIERLIVSRIAHILELSPLEVSREENFLELGLDSITLLDLSTWLSEAIKIDLYPTLLFEYPTIGELADYFSDTYTHQFQDFMDKERAENIRTIDAKTTDEGKGRHIVREKAIKEKNLREIKIFKILGEINKNDIAVIGIAGRFPKASSPEVYWQNFENGIDGITNIPTSRFEMDQILKKHPDLILQGGFLQQVEFFDPLFFNISPMEADYIDPQQRLFLETSWQVLEMAGYNQEKLKNLKTGVFVGASQVEYRNIQPLNTELSPYMGLGNSLSLIANRVSYLFNLKGPSLTIDTACSSSLVAIHLACQSLKNDESDISIAGGVQIYLSPDTFAIFHLSKMLSKEGRCKTFDKSADGYVRGEGVGAVLLKPLKRALKDGDIIYAVIKGSAVNHDGSNKVGISAPNPNAQKRVIKDVLEKSQINPETINYIEAHGTGTSLGDPVEIEALTQVYGEYTQKRAYCAIGTAKSYIGHLEAAAGIAGFIRAIMALRNKKIPPTLNFQQPNPHIPFNDTPFYVNDRILPWSKSNGKRRAGISSFGFGGTNCHVVVEEFEEPMKDSAKGYQKPVENILILTAKTEQTISCLVKDTIDFLDENPNISFNDLCFSYNTGKNFFDYRLCIFANSLEQMRDRLEIINLKGYEKSPNPFGIFYGIKERSQRKYAFYFGENFTIETIKPDIENLSMIFPEFQKCSEILKKFNGFGFSIDEVAFSNEKIEKLNNLVTFSLMYSTIKIWISMGIKPSLLVGGWLGGVVCGVILGKSTLEEVIKDLLYENQLILKKDEGKTYYFPFSRKEQNFSDEEIQSFKTQIKRNRIDCIINMNGGEFFLELIALSYTPKSSPLIVPCLSNHKGIWASLLLSIGRLLALGVNLNPSVLYKGIPVRILKLPTYPFQRKRFWINSAAHVKKSATPMLDSKISNIYPREFRSSTITSGKNQENCLNFLIRLIGDLLRVKDSDLDIKANFKSLGIDSLIIQKAIHGIEGYIGKSIEPSVFLNYPTIESLTSYLSSVFNINESADSKRSEKPSINSQINLEKSRACLNKNNSHQVQAKVPPGAVAIVGFACRFPGAKDYTGFWDNLANGIDSTKEIPLDRWDAINIFKKNNLNLEKNCIRGGFIEDIDKFAASFFDIPEEDAIVIDPQQRLLLEIAWQTFEQAGYSKHRMWNKNVGVFIGARSGTYKANLSTNTIRSFLTGSISNFIAARISDYFNLKGPSLVFDTACSSSLVALHYACQSILNGECEMALSGGVELKIRPDSYITLNLAKALSPDGRTYTFDKRANGFVPGEGVGAILLKPLQKAIEDRDTIYALVLGSAVNNDGSTMGITTPEIESQKRVIELALNNSGVHPKTISYVEAHGTGTMIGDPIEIKALTQIYNKFTSHRNFCAIGSVKTNIGHLETAAGIAGLIKVILAMNNKQIPATLNCFEPNPRFSFIQSPFYLNTNLRHWYPIYGTRRAGISSFGFGGTNCHLILEEAPVIHSNNQLASNDSKSFIFTLSAKSEASLKNLESNYKEWLEKESTPKMEDICFTVNVGRETFPYRKAVVCKNKSDLLKKLSSGDGWSSYVPDFPILAFMFPGQGALYPGVTKQLYDSERVFRKSLDRCNEIISMYFDKSIFDLLFSSNKVSMTETRVTQPLTFAVSYSLAKMWLTWGVKPSMVLGHSVGEYVAATIAGVFSLEDALKLVSIRGQLMHDFCSRGSMAIFFTDQKHVKDYLFQLSSEERKRVSIASINGPRNIVISGEKKLIVKLLDLANREKVGTHLLEVSHAFHSPLMDPMLSEFSKILDKIHFSPNTIDLISNVTGEVVNDSLLAKDYWLRHIKSPVQFASSVQEGIKQGINIFLEAGPGTTLTSMVNRMLIQKPQFACSTLNKGKEDWQSILECVAELYSHGVDLDFEMLYGDKGRRIALPTYPFDRKKYWIEQNIQANQENFDLQFSKYLPSYQEKCSDSKNRIKLGEEILFKPTWIKKDLEKTSLINLNKPVIFLMHRDHRHEVFAQKFEESNIPVIRIFSGKESASNMNSFVIDPAKPEQLIQLISRLLEKYDISDFFHLWTFTGVREYSDIWERLEQGQIQGIFSIFNLTKALVGSKKRKPLRIRILTSFSQSVTGSENHLAFEKTPMLGMVKVIPLEFSWIKCFVYDMHPTTGKTWPQELYDEIFNCDKDILVAYREGFRWIPVLSPVSDKEVCKPQKLLKKNGTYLITGGFGGIGLELAKYLAKYYQARILLLSRSFDIPRNQWHDYLESNKNKKFIQNIRSILDLESLGCQIIPLKADITKLEEMQEVMKKIENMDIQINGLFHLAGIIADKILLRKDLSEFKRVMDPKIKGTCVLSQILLKKELDFVVFFSSLVSILGNPGQTDYASGNSFLDYYALYLKSKGIPALSINWPMWSEVGMGVKSGSIESSKNQRLNALSTEQGFEILERALEHAEHPQLIVINDPKLKELLVNHIQQNDCIHNKFQDPSPDVTREKNYPKNEIKKIQEYLMNVANQFVTIQEGNIKSFHTFFDIGLESETLVQMARKVENDLDIQLYPTIFFEYQTIEAFSKYLFEYYHEKILTHLPSFSQTAEFIKERIVESPAGIPLEIDDKCGREGFNEIKNHANVNNSTDLYFPDKNKDTQYQDDIAIIGMAGRFPHSDNIYEFWELLKDGKDIIEKIPFKRWNVDDFFDPNPGIQGKTYLEKGGFIDGVDQFDAAFFNISPKEAKEMDPQQRIFLEACYHALEHAGYGGKKLRHSNTGIFVGVSYNQYDELLNTISPYTALGNSRAIIANRVSYFLNSHGPSMVVDTLCSSSMVAIHLASQSLKNGECEFALAGGVFAVLNPIYYIGGSNLSGFSPTGKCKTFDSSADGYVPGEGVGVVLLKPLKKAIEERDCIYAIIKGSAVNHDGRSNNLAAPNSSAQAKVIRAALKDSQVSPETISYVEAHGTGTSLGDPVEISGLTKAFNKFCNSKGFCALGSVKTNIGHTEPAAGVTGLIKVVLAMKYKKLPPTLNFHKINPFIDLVNTPFYINDKLADWESSTPCRAGISSFGMGGTNAHAILESYPGPSSIQPKHERPFNILTLSARSKDSLTALISSYHKYFYRNNKEQAEDVCYTASTGRGHYSHRLAVVGQSFNYFRDILNQIRFQGIEKISALNECFYNSNAKYDPELVFIYGNIDHNLDNIPHRFIHYLKSEPGSLGIMKKYQQFMNSQIQNPSPQRLIKENPLILFFFLEYALTKLLSSWNIVHSSVTGIGNGKYLSNVISGSMNIEDALSELINNKPNRQNLTLKNSVFDGFNKNNNKNVIFLFFGKPDIDLEMKLKDHEVIYIDQMNEIALGTLISKLYVLGPDIDWDIFYSSSETRKLELPLYPFERKSYWIEEDSKHRKVVPQTHSTEGVEDNEETLNFVDKKMGERIPNIEINNTVADEVENRLQTNKKPDEILKNQLKEKIAQIFVTELIDKLEFREEDIDADADLKDYGFDSVFAVQMMKVYEEKVNVSLDPTLLFDYKTINEFSAYLAEEYEIPFQQYYNSETFETKPEEKKLIIPVTGNSPTDLSQSEDSSQNAKNRRAKSRKPLLKGKRIE